MEKVFVAKRVANKLVSTEAAVDAAIVEVGEMMAELLQARTEATWGGVAASGPLGWMQSARAVFQTRL